MFSFKIAFLDLLGQWIDLKKKIITREIMMKNQAHITSGPSIAQNNAGLFSIINLHMADIQDLHKELEFLTGLEHNNHIVETLKNFTEKMIWTDHERQGMRGMSWK